MRTKYVVVVNYEERWITDFLELKERICQSLGDLALKIEHVGSTSVPGLAAKPIIDIDVMISDTSLLPLVIEKLESIGYAYRGDLGIPDREAFSYEGEQKLPTHHLYVCSAASEELKRHIRFRDYLRTHEDAVLQYSRIKLDGAKLFPTDIDGYMEYKSEFIERIYEIM